MFLTELLGIGDDDAFDLGGLPGAIVGAVVLLWGYERFVASRAPAAPARTQAPGQLEGGRGGERRASERRRAEGGGERRRQRRDRPEGDL
jgi:hypothetical protein